MNPLRYTIVAQHLESKGIFSIYGLYRFLGALEILAQQSAVNEQYTDSSLRYIKRTIIIIIIIITSSLLFS